jgi:hypothetical protein
MIIGIVSDSHGRTDRLAAALELLRDRGARAVVHCGDVGGLEDLKVLGRCGLVAWAVLGNVDRHVQRLLEAAWGLGIDASAEVVQVDLSDGRRLAATHGHDGAQLRELIAQGQFAYVCHGHSHLRRDDRIGGTRIINPGALHRSAPPSLAVLDTVADRLEFLELTAR